MFLESMRISNERLYQQGLMKGKMEGKIEGKVEGKVEGQQEEKLEVAKAMLEEGIAISVIAKITKLSSEEIERLRH